MLVRYFGAAQAAAGVAEEAVDMPAGAATLNEVLLELVRRHPAELPRGGEGVRRAPSLSSVITRSSFLRNETAVRDRTSRLADNDVIDILPPFAGG